METEPDAPTGATPGWEQSPDGRLVGRLLAGDEAAFTQIVDAWSSSMLRVARTRVSTTASAEELVQETWLTVITGLERFEGRSSLRTWVFRILENKAKTRGVREARTVPWSSLDSDHDGPTVDSIRFEPAGDEWAGHWTDARAPSVWSSAPSDAVLASELRTSLGVELRALPERQRLVVSLRDVDGLSSDEVCTALDISAANQRVLLHRGRARLRLALEQERATAEAEDAL